MFQFSKQNTNVVKALAIVGVLIHHLFMNATPDSGWASALIVAQPIALFCKACLGIFVFLSAFGLTKSWKRLASDSELTDTQKGAVWVRSRYLKLMSGYWFAYFVIVVVTAFTDRNIVAVFSNEALPKLSVALDFLGFGNFFGTMQFCETWWYMSLAILVTMSVPMLYQLENRFGPIFLIVGLMVFNYVLQAYSVPADYILSALLGVYAANHNSLERIHTSRITGICLVDSLLKIALCTTGIFLTYTVRMKIGRAYIVDGVFALFCVIGITEIVELRYMKWLKVLLAFVGKHSMNIFLVHTFIFSYYFTDFIYSFHYPAMITLALLGTSLFASITIELLKKFLCYEKFINKLEQMLTNRIRNNYDQALF